MPIVKYYTAQVCLAQGIAVFTYLQHFLHKLMLSIFQLLFLVVLLNPNFSHDDSYFVKYVWDLRGSHLLTWWIFKKEKKTGSIAFVHSVAKTSFSLIFAIFKTFSILGLLPFVGQMKIYVSIIHCRQRE